MNLQQRKAIETESTATRHTREDALSDMEFEQLVNASYEMDPIHDLETQLILLVGGRFGLRRGEMSHMKADWINWRQRRIEIPSFEPCRKGRDGGPCGHCRQMAQQMVDHGDIEFEEALAGRWAPKTDMAIRSVPFGFIPRVEIVLDRYFGEFDEFMYTGQAINRRLDWVAEIAGLDKNVYPHALRATAASYHAGRGLDTFALQAMMGWVEPSTARNYIARSSDNLDRQLFTTHG